MDKEAILYSGTQSTEDLQVEETDPEIMETDTFEYKVTATVLNPTVKTSETKKNLRNLWAFLDMQSISTRLTFNF